MSSVQLTAADFHAARRFAETSFGRIAYVERGEGPAALFFHGFSLNGYQWRSHFTDVFRREFGQTPSEVRKNATVSKLREMSKNLIA